MGRRPKNWCQIGIVKAIQAAVPGSLINVLVLLTWQCTCMVVGSMNIALQKTERKTNFLPTGQYLIYSRMKNQVIDDVLNNLSVRTNKNDSTNNNMTTKEVHADSNNNNNNNNTGFVLVPNIKQEDGVDKGYQERCRVASIQFAAERSAAATITSSTTRATAFGHEYDKTIMPKGVDTVYRIVNTVTGNLGGAGCDGEIYGELTKSSMHKLVQLMVASTN